ncbi:MAG: efflux RND transporter periplasmic adaptor subunit [Patescibacteria group bacterium]
MGIKARKSIVFIVLIIIILFISSYFLFFRTEKTSYEIIEAKRSDIVQKVSATGRIKPATSIDLAFEKSGKVAKVYVDIGDKVFIGKILANLNNADILAQIKSVEANLKSQQAKLDELRKGTRPEQIQIYEVKVENAQVALDDAKNNLVDKLQDAYTKSDDAIRNKVDQFFSNARGSNPQINFNISNSQLKNDIEWERFLIEETLVAWQMLASNLSISNVLDSYIQTAKNNLDQTKIFLDKIALAVNYLIPTADLSQTTIDSWKADVSTARTNINTAISNLLLAEEKLRTSQSNLLLVQNELALQKAGSTPEAIKAQEALVEQAEANVENYKAELAKTIIYSPVNGVVTVQDAKVGEIIPANKNVISIISESNFEIEVDVPEADIAKVKINDSADITLDAYGKDIIFRAKVVKIDPGEIIIEGVATYKTTLQFINNDGGVKSGMTANIDILTAKREKVIVVPQRAIAVKENGDKIVKVLKDGNSIEERKVNTGLKGSDGNIEIIEGIKEGEKLITSQK